MRVLFTTQPAFGHFHPLVPLAHSLQRQGHEVAVATGASFAPVVERCGLPFLPTGLDWLEEGGGLARTFPKLREFNDLGAGNAYVVGEIFAHITAVSMARDLTLHFREWKPDLLVSETFEFGGALAAELEGLPYATVQVGSFAAMESWRPWASKGLAKARATLTLPEDPDLTMLYRHLLLSFVPPSFQNPEVSLPPTARVFRTSVFDRSGGGESPRWPGELRAAPHVCMTMGTVLVRTVPLFKTALEALAQEPLNLTITVGQHHDPAAFGPQPANVRIERYLPLSDLLPHCDLVINHGGFSTVLASLAHGLPMILIPVNADQHDNSRRCLDLGVAQVIEPKELTASQLKDSVLEMLDMPSYHQRSGALRDEMLSLPSLEDAVDALQQLADSHQPKARHPQV